MTPALSSLRNASTASYLSTVPSPQLTSIDRDSPESETLLSRKSQATKVNPRGPREQGGATTVMSKTFKKSTDDQGFGPRHSLTFCKV